MACPAGPGRRPRLAPGQSRREESSILGFPCQKFPCHNGDGTVESCRPVQAVHWAIRQAEVGELRGAGTPKVPRPFSDETQASENVGASVARARAPLGKVHLSAPGAAER